VIKLANEEKKKKPKGSFVDPAEAGKEKGKEKKGKRPKTPPPSEMPLITILTEIKDAITEKEQGTVHQLCRIADALEKLVSQQPEVAQVKTTSTPDKKTSAKTTESKYIEKARNLFEPYDAEQLSFMESTDEVIIKPQKFLGSELFAKIAAVVRDAGGEYVSAGKDSHFRIKKEQLD
jgi:hypothetical protein